MGNGEGSTGEDTFPALKVISGEQKGRVYVLREREVLIGRSDACDIVLNQEPVSRIHAKIMLGAVIIMAEDLDSTNGTFIDDVQVKESALTDGNRLKIGDNVFLFIAKHRISSAGAVADGRLEPPGSTSQDATTKC